MGNWVSKQAVLSCESLFSIVLRELAMIKTKQSQMEVVIEMLKKHNHVHHSYLKLKDIEISKQEKCTITASKLEVKGMQVDNTPEAEHISKVKVILFSHKY